MEVIGLERDIEGQWFREVQIETNRLRVRIQRVKERGGLGFREIKREISRAMGLEREGDIKG